MMKAVILNGFGGTENFTMEEADTPTNPANNVLVKIKATAFNPIDYQIQKGAPESKLLKSPILGRELSGIITEVGSSVSAFFVGDEVMSYVGSLASNGTYTEYISIPQQLLASKPAGISFEEAAALPMAGLTALQCFERLQIQADDSVFVSGAAGGVGTMLIKLFIATGIDQVITTAGSEESHIHLKELGVKESNIINYRYHDWQQKALALNNGNLFDFCIDLVGESLSEDCSRLLKINGTYADVTNLQTDKAREELFDKGVVVVNISNYAHALNGELKDFSYYGEKLKALLCSMDKLRIDPPKVHVVGKLGLESVRKAHHILENNKTGGRKLVMTIA